VSKAAAIDGSQHHASSSALPVPVAANYVVFSKHISIVLRQPVPIAWHRRGEAGEKWNTDAQSKSIRRLLLGDSRRGLRTTNPFRPHRHLRRSIDERWIDELRSALKGVHKSRGGWPRRSNEMSMRRRC
jgi:hypothetical protein